VGGVGAAVSAARRGAPVAQPLAARIHVKPAATAAAAGGASAAHDGGGGGGMAAGLSSASHDEGPHGDRLDTARDADDAVARKRARAASEPQPTQSADEPSAKRRTLESACGGIRTEPAVAPSHTPPDAAASCSGSAHRSKDAAHRRPLPPPPFAAAAAARQSAAAAAAAAASAAIKPSVGLVEYDDDSD
jgi:hypothetical protein